MGWLVRSADGEPFPGRPEIFRGADRRTATFLFSDENGEPHEFKLERRLFVYPKPLAREQKALSNGIAYIRFSSFDDEAAKFFETAVKGSDSGTGIIIDLRGNTGGLVKSLRSMLDLVLPSKSPVGEFIERDSDERRFVLGRRDHFKGRIAVLVDERSASASEIFASAMRDLKRGVVIGGRTSGQMLNSDNFDLPEGFTIQIPIRDFVTANGVRIEGVGVEPDIPVVETVGDFRAGRDPALAAAVAALSR